MKEVSKKCMIKDMAKTQDLIKNNLRYLTHYVIKMYLMKDFSYDSFMVFSLRHGMCNDCKEHSFSEISKMLDFDLEKTLKLYNEALRKVSNKIISKHINNEIIV